MITTEEILNVTVKVRREIGYPYNNLPKIITVDYDEQDNKLYILCGDRPDRAILMGPGGRVLVELAKRLNVNLIIVRAYTDVLLRQERIIQAINNARKIADKIKSKEISKFIRDRLIPLAEREIINPLKKRILKATSIDIEAIVSYSGGVDSSATAIYAKALGINVKPITVDPGPFIIPKRLKERIKEFTRNNCLNVEFVRPKENFKNIINNSMNGRYAPCKKCHNIIVRTIYQTAEKFGKNIVFFGDLLPTGKHSLRIEDKILRINLPAYIALTKSDTIIISKLHGYKVKKLRYGCPLFRAVVKRNKHLKLVAYQRILRETRAGVLEPNQALKLMKSIERL